MHVLVLFTTLDSYTILQSAKACSSISIYTCVCVCVGTLYFNHCSVLEEIRH